MANNRLRFHARRLVMSSNNREISGRLSMDYLTITRVSDPFVAESLAPFPPFGVVGRYQTDKLECACLVLPRFGHARMRRSWQASRPSYFPIWQDQPPK